MMATHSGSCHCGKIAYDFESDPITGGLSCNCSICQRKGSILHFVPASAFNLKTPREDLSTYKFNKQVIAHYFCGTCGVSPFAEATSPKGEQMAAINLRCVDGVDPQKLTIQHFDGRSA
jgi:hypothetical protein